MALKQIIARHADDPTSRSRFLLEAEITGGLEHPGIVPVYGMGVYKNGRPYYAMRFIRGESLQGSDRAVSRSPGAHFAKTKSATQRPSVLTYRRIRTTSSCGSCFGASWTFAMPLSTPIRGEFCIETSSRAISFWASMEKRSLSTGGSPRRPAKGMSRRKSG